MPGDLHTCGVLPFEIPEWFPNNVARNSPAYISSFEIVSLKFRGILDTYEKLGYPNYVRVLVDEAPEASSCVRSSSHDTVHDPRDTSNTTSYTLKCEEPDMSSGRTSRQARSVATGQVRGN